MHAVDGDLHGSVGSAGTGKDRVHRLDALAVVIGQARHDGLGEQLTAEDH